MLSWLLSRLLIHLARGRSVDPSVTPIPEKPPEPATGWFFMLRQDQYDQISYISRPLPFQVIQGASASYVQDQLSRTASLSSKGYLGVSAYNWTSPCLDNGCSVSNSRRPPVLQGFGAGGFIQANGNYTDPMSAGERSALRFGVNVNAYLCNTPVFPIQDVQMIPYYQTDFRGRAGITGFNMLWSQLIYSTRFSSASATTSLFRSLLAHTLG